jgi:2'-hydroxyisoflavone reductase
VIDRRHFLTTAGAVSTGIALGASTQLMAAPPQEKSAGARSGKRLLILGGTGFIGPPMVRYAVERGHEVTIFTRGKTKSSLPDVEHLVGDRSNDLNALQGRTWDAVLDNNARDYRWVALTADLLKDKVEHYLFVSSISAYAGEASGYEYIDKPWSGPPIDTNSPLALPPKDFAAGEELPYGQTKTESERIASSVFPGRATIVRPGFIVGPGDRSDRFTYWPARINNGGEVLAPGDGTDPVQIIDVRDLTEWIVRLVENATYGSFNGVGPESTLSMAEMLYGIRAITSSDVKFTWVPISFLREHNVQSYSDMPIWIPGDPMSFVDNSLAMASGLTFRPLAVTAANTLEWHLARPAEQQAELRIGIKPDREKQVLTAWHKSKS